MNYNVSLSNLQDAAYCRALMDDIYFKIIDGEIDVSPTIRYFKARDYEKPCEAMYYKYLEIIEKPNSLKVKRFIFHFAVFFTFLDIFTSLTEMASNIAIENEIVSI